MRRGLPAQVRALTGRQVLIRIGVTVLFLAFASTGRRMTPALVDLNNLVHLIAVASGIAFIWEELRPTDPLEELDEERDA